jgi:hypothetical protein
MPWIERGGGELDLTCLVHRSLCPSPCTFLLQRGNGTKFLGKPYEPNAIIKNDIEFILMQRKPGGYRVALSIGIL